jgi:prepilin-type N-terminal cleavage/methylation domain-containing protein
MNRGTTKSRVTQAAQSAVSRVAKPACPLESRSAFTLIELLVVIAIIGVLASLIIPLSGIATTKMRISRVKAELNQYVTAIESYKLETGSFPPDVFGNLRLTDPGRYSQVLNDPVLYTNWTSTNALFYELTGAIFTNNMFRTLVDGENITPKNYEAVFNVSGIQNSARNKHDIPYKGFSIRPNQYAELNLPGIDAEVLNVPVPGPREFKGRNNKMINPWHYDSSTTNRHNRAGFDLWAEIIIGRKNDTIIIGNWKN